MRILKIFEDDGVMHGAAIIVISDLLRQLKSGMESGKTRHYLCELVSENISREIFEEGERQYIGLDSFVETLTQGLKLLEEGERRFVPFGYGVFDQLTLNDISTLVGYDVYYHRNLGILTCDILGNSSPTCHHQWVSNSLQFQLRVGLLERLLSMGVTEIKVDFHFD